jgi:hypothetical protein
VVVWTGLVWLRIGTGRALVNAAVTWYESGTSSLKELKKRLRLRITVFLHFVHRPKFQIAVNTTFRKLDLIPSSVEERETPTVLSHLERSNLNH